MFTDETEELLRAWRGETSTAPKRTTPRKKGEHSTSAEWELAERMYVEGERDGNDVTYKSRSEIARAIGVTCASIDQRCRRYNWVERRILFQKTSGIIPAGDTRNGQPHGVVGRPTEGGKAARRGRRDPEALLKAYIDEWGKRLDEGKIGFSSVAELEKAVRLLAFVRGQADSIKATHATVTLEVMTGRHRAMRELTASRVDDEVAGVLAERAPDDVIDVEGVPVPALPAHEDLDGGGVDGVIVEGEDAA